MSDELENEVVFELEMCNSRESYVKPLYRKITRKHAILYHIIVPLIIIENIVWVFMSRSSLKLLWFALMLIIFAPGIIERNQML